MPTPSSVIIHWPDRIIISPSSSENFEHFNPQGYGTFFVITRYDGSVTPLIPHTHDIDADLRAVLETLAHDITSQPVIACGNVTGIFIVRFDVPSGKVYHVEVRPRMNSGL
jgi:hypothetical protein